MKLKKEKPTSPKDALAAKAKPSASPSPGPGLVKKMKMKKGNSKSPVAAVMDPGHRKALKLRGLPLVGGAKTAKDFRQLQLVVAKKKRLEAVKVETEAAPAETPAKRKKKKNKKKNKSGDKPAEAASTPKPQEDGTNQKQGQDQVKILKKKKNKKKSKKPAAQSEPGSANGVEAEDDGVESAISVAAKRDTAMEKFIKLRDKIMNHQVQKLVEKKTVAPTEEKLRKNIVKAVAAVMIASKKGSAAGDKKELFDDPTDVKIFLRVGLFKYPKANHTYRVNLPHPFLTRSREDRPAEICLFVKDLERGRDAEPEDTVRHYQELLQAAGVNVVTRIVPMKEIKSEFNHFKLKANMSRQYDVYLADRRYFARFGALLGKDFAKLGSKRFLDVDLTAADLKAEFTKTLSKAYMPWKATSDQGSMWIGVASQPEDHVVANVEAALKKIRESISGTWANVRNINLQTNVHSLAVPIYLSLSSGNSVKVVEKNANRDANVVAGPVTTEPGTTVVIDAQGRIRVQRAERPAGGGDRTPKLTQPLALAPSLPSSAAKVAAPPVPVPVPVGVEQDEDFDPEDEEMREPGKLVKLEHAYLRRKLMEEGRLEDGDVGDGGEKKDDKDAKTDDALNSSSSLEGVSKRQKRKRKINTGPAAAAASPGQPSPKAPKSPTPDYPAGDGATPVARQVADGGGVSPSQGTASSPSTPGSGGKKKRNRKRKSGVTSTPVPASSPSPAPAPAAAPNSGTGTPGKRGGQESGGAAGSGKVTTKEMTSPGTPSAPPPKSPTPDYSASASPKQTPQSSAKKQKKKTKSGKSEGGASVQKPVAPASGTGDKKGPHGILKRTSLAAPTSPTRSATKAAMAPKPTPGTGRRSGPGAAASGRVTRVRFSLPNNKSGQKKGRRKTML